MNWEQRLREMVLAGGALAAAACADNSGSASDASSSQDAASLDTQPDAVGNTSNFCCNANPDPCCAYLYCDGPMTPACNQEMSFEAEGGTFNPQDAAPPDAQPDAVGDGFDGSFCCNANPDPCCTYLHCGGPMTSVCNQEMSCEAEGGTCAPRDAARTDTGADEHD